MSSPFKISPFFTHHQDPKKVRSTRHGKTIYVTGKPGKYKFYNSPQYEGHEPSSHLMADDNKREAWPSIYRDSITGALRVFGLIKIEIKQLKEGNYILLKIKIK